MASIAFAEHKKTEAVSAHVLWMTTGLSCEGDSVALTGRLLFFFAPEVEERHPGTGGVARCTSCR